MCFLLPVEEKGQRRAKGTTSSHRVKRRGGAGLMVAGPWPVIESEGERTRAERIEGRERMELTDNQPAIGYGPTCNGGSQECCWERARKVGLAQDKESAEKGREK